MTRAGEGEAPLTAHSAKCRRDARDVIAEGGSLGMAAPTWCEDTRRLVRVTLPSRTVWTLAAGDTHLFTGESFEKPVALAKSAPCAHEWRLIDREQRWRVPTDEEAAAAPWLRRIRDGQAALWYCTRCRLIEETS